MRRLCIRATAAVTVVLIAMVLPVDPVDPVKPTLAPGMLPPGVYPLLAFDTGESSAYHPSSDPGPALTVTHVNDRQRQQYRTYPGEFEIELLAANATPLNPRGTLLSMLMIDGIYFFADPPVKWRDVNAAGVVVPDQPWTWTLHSSNGGVTVTQNAVARQPAIEMVDGAVVSVQRIDATLTFSGNVSGTLQLRHWEEVGNYARSRQQFSGTVTILGTPTRVNTTVILGGLGGLPGLN